MDDIERLVDKSHDEFVKERGTKILGLDADHYCALLMFVDAFVDVAQAEYPLVASKVVQPSRDLVDTVPEYLESRGIDIEDYVDLKLAHELLAELDNFFERISINDLIRHDREAFAELILSLLGHDVEVRGRAKTFLKQNGERVPTEDDIKLALDQRRYDDVYRLFKALGMLKESKDIRGAVERARTELEAAAKDADPATKRQIVEILYQLDSVRYD